jgi:trk system potassium uptake protein TrkA
MKIILVGAGKVGTTVLKYLVEEGHDVTVIDNDHKTLEETINNYDVQGVVGNGASRAIQIEAQAERADMVIATASNDELNILSCLVGKKLGIPYAVARVRNPDYSEQMDFLERELGIDLIVNPELEAAAEILKILRFPSATTIETFSKDRIEIVEMRVRADSVLANKPLKDIRHDLGIKFLICAVERKGEIAIPGGDFIVKPEDKLYVIAEKNDIVQFFKKIGLYKARSRNVMIIGGSKITYYLAKQLLDEKTGVKIIEVDERRAHELSAALPEAAVIVGNGSNQTLLFEEGIEKMDAVVTLTGLDEENIVISLLAEKVKVPKVITKISHFENPDILENIGLETVIAPKSFTAYKILRYIRSLSDADNKVITLYKFFHDKAEAAEFFIEKESKYTGVQLKDLRLKGNTIIACIKRGNQIIIPGGEDAIQSGDSVIVISANKYIKNFEEIFR